jgi:hypothetical protein
MDPRSRRSTPPEHPAGYPALEDAPVHLAPAVDVRDGVRRSRELRDRDAEARRSRSWPPISPQDDEPPRVGTTAPMGLEPEPAPESEPHSAPGTLLYTLAFPVEERHSTPPASEPTDEPSPRTVAFEPVEPFEPSPRTVAFEPVVPIVPRASVPIGDPAEGPTGNRPNGRLEIEHFGRSAEGSFCENLGERALEPEAPPESAPPPSAYVPMPSVAPPFSIPPALAPLLDAHDPTGEREAIARDLASIGALDERPDREIDRDLGAKATLARARALRFRLTMIESVEEPTAPGGSFASATGVVPIDLAIEAGLFVGLADGAPFVRHAEGGAELAFARALASFLRAARPDLPRSVLRDRGASAIARMTIAGYRVALDSLARAALGTSVEGRSLALQAAAYAALAPAANAHRLGALGDLERALALPTGSVARALELAHRRRQDARTPPVG